MTWASAEADASARRAHGRRGVAGGVRLRDIAFFVEPTLGAAAHQHAVAVLDGYGNRDAGGFALARADRVHTVAVSWPPYASCPAARSGIQVLCFVPSPGSTQGEARAGARLASTGGGA